MLRKKLFHLLIVSFLLITASSYSADYVNPQLLVTPEAVEKNMGKWILLDCRDEKAYSAGHIPGAVNLGDACAKVLRDTTLRVKKPADLEKILGSAGISTEKPVVVYADARLITGASVGFWILEYLGHDSVYFLNGGIERWATEGKAIETTAAKLPQAVFKTKVVKSRIATTDEMGKIAKGEIRDINVIDSRSEKEHKGNDIRALRGGNIPNTTINVPHINTYDVQSGRIHSMDELEKIFGQTIDKTKRTIPYCQTGTRSTLTYLELRLMGFKDPANYDDSWIVYGSNVDLPAANENWYDFVKVNDTIKTIDELKKDIEALKKKQ